MVYSVSALNAAMFTPLNLEITALENRTGRPHVGGLDISVPFSSYMIKNCFEFTFLVDINITPWFCVICCVTSQDICVCSGFTLFLCLIG